MQALRLEENSAALLKRLGLKTIGQLAAAPRSSFAARAGEHALLRLDQALGRAPEALTPRRPAPPVYAARRFLEPIFTIDALMQVTGVLIEDALKQLDLRGAGARRAALYLFGVDGRDRCIEIGLSRPEREAKAMLRLLSEKLNQAGETLDMEFGIESARLDIVALERLDPTAQTLVAESDAASDEKIAAIIDLVSARLGRTAVLKPLLRDVHAPERAGAWHAALDPMASLHKIAPAADGVMRRPLTVFVHPQQIEAVAEVPDAPPVRFRWRRVLREIARAEGPERIAGNWLKGELTRDYYRVEDKDGRRYWLFREGLYGETDAPRWFMHGLFA